ncbi:hypothetical protein [Aliihoeflea sp. 40Bstr573]|uniref:hypothetical protein n=1 Tax=Aliihoeflea sp. 40Bstr573 TaxID=2696467 RepID=UPI0020943EA6|nr:hypothetical protein [Aliihoeflea sp. 40Bstr573]MCO6387765.1 hypothetical protein [Aliihoeflea sp. 40Bstr573]
MGDEEKYRGRERPANDNHAPEGQQAGSTADASERVDAVVMSIARLIGRRMAREDYEDAMRAANDNASSKTNDDDR